MAFLAAALPVLGAIGTAVSAVGSIESGLYAGQVAKNNAKIAGQNANYAREAGTVEAGQQSMRGAAKSAAIKGAMAANGVDVNSGSAAEVEASQAGVNELDVETVLHNSELSAYGYTTQQKSFEAQGDQDVIGGILGGVSTLAEGASSLNWKWGKTSAPLGSVDNSRSWGATVGYGS